MNVESASEAVDEADSGLSDAPPVLHVMVVGFHHKKGAVVEYCWPNSFATSPVDPTSSNSSTLVELPLQWRHLPSLALPDGSHNFESDTCYFHLPSLEDPRKSVYGISCFRQIASDRVVNRSADITRASVQKSVCAISRLPLYGHIQVKMNLITRAYFDEGDFSRVDLINQTLDNLNACLSRDMLSTQQLYVGLSARSFISTFRHRALALFKLMLLERKVVFFQSPVHELCGNFLTLLSLHPGMLEKGLDEAARIVPADTPPSTSPCPPVINETEGADVTDSEALERPSSVLSEASSVTSVTTGIRGKLSGALGYIAGYKNPDEDGENDKTTSSKDEDVTSSENAKEENAAPAPDFNDIAGLSVDEFGLPLKMFTGGNLCHPYTCLSYLDVLGQQDSVHGYMIGATNVLFKQKKGIAEVLIDIEKDRIDVHDPELRKALSLTTEDLRFIDNIVKKVTEESSNDGFLDGVGWEGGDEWVRAQFRFYLLCLLRTSLVDESGGEAASGLFNASFMQQWKRTRSYWHWRHGRAECASRLRDALPPGHPFAGQLSVTDMKLHLSNTMTNTESGKRVSQVVSSTGRAVAGGLSSARGAFSSLMTSLRPQTVVAPHTDVAPVHQPTTTEAAQSDE